MGFEWTKEQAAVITLRDRNILVSAAAGSGKTAVLVERIIGRILEEKNPVDIDKLLIVTFTNAAAAEMRERIGAAIEKAIEKNPFNAHLQKQAALIHHAQITTIHSFCLYLIRNYFHRIDLEPNFRIAEEGELNLLTEDVLDEVLTSNYERNEKDSAFFDFVECFATGKNDDVLHDILLKIYHFAMSYPWPKEWLLKLSENYEFDSVEEMEQKEWAVFLLSYVQKITTDLLAFAEENIRLTLEADGPTYCAAVAEHDKERLMCLAQAKGYRKIAEEISAFSLERLPSKRGYDGNEELLEQFKENRTEIKDTVKKLGEQFFFAPQETQLERMKKMKPVIEELVRLTIEFTEAYDERKRQKNILDFNDLEHFALKILIDEETKEPTEAAAECRLLFEEVMIDEYQDSNLVQETLLRAVSRETEGTYNRFMVGDVKQSIYRFRLARPELFTEKYDTYTSEESKCQKIELHQNFRSRKEVLEFTNDIFYKIMKKDLGNVEYDEAAALYTGAVYPEALDMRAEILLADTKEDVLEEAGLTEPVRLEAELAAARIGRLLREQKITDKKTGELRNVCYSDIVILFRSTAKYADTFLEVFAEKGIPAHASSKTGYFQTIEIQTVLSFLRVIDNPRQDIALAAALRSPIGGFTDEELAKIKAAGGKKQFYACFLALAEREAEIDDMLVKKITNFMKLIDDFRDLVTELPIHELLYRILEETGYLSYASAMPSGAQRKANLEMLLEKASAYEKTSYKGLFHFIRYIDRLQKYEVDYGEADADGGSENAVRIMTIHKSKGLEFPIVFLCGTGKKFNRQDIRSALIMHPELGVGADYINPKDRIKGATLYKKAVAKQLDLENEGEELRVLYVALTRAKEKLIITGTGKNLAERIEKTKRKTSDGALSYLTRVKADCFLDWLLPAALSYGDKYPIEIWNVKELVTEEAAEQLDELEGLNSLLSFAKENASEDEKTEEEMFVEERLSWKYPYMQETTRKMKYSVSELKHRAMDEAELSNDSEREAAAFLEAETETENDNETENETEIEPYIPKFISGSDEKNIGALRGTAMHRAVECFSVIRLAGAENLKEALDEELEKNVADGHLTEEMSKFLRRDKLMKFYCSNLAMRMKNAAEKKNYTESSRL